MKRTTIALAIAFALQSTLAFAEGPMNLADPAVRDATIHKGSPIAIGLVLREYDHA